MPLPAPQPSETLSDWLKRCMSDETMVGEFTDPDQRAAVCQQIWRDAHAARSAHDDDATLFEARISLPFTAGEVPEWIMWMPAGVHEITATRGGKPWTGKIHVGPEDAAVVQSALSELLKGKQRPYIDFDHSGGAAAGWPLEAAWRDQPEPGIWIRVEWSAAGRDAILGRTYRAFSPRWYASEDADGIAHVAGLPLNIGGLVNDPAFREIEPIWSKNTARTMSTTNTEMAALQARIAELEAQKQELEARLESDETRAALEAAQAELNTTRDKLARLEQELEARKRRDADACIQAAVARGAIAPKDETTIERWRKLILEDPANAELLAKLPGRPALQAGHGHATATRAQSAGRTRVEVIQPDISDVLRGYLSAGTPRDRGWVYYKEIKPIIERGERIPWERAPVEAANVLGTLVGNIIAQRILDLVVSRRPMLRNVTTDFSDQQARKGQTIYTRAVAVPAVQDFGSGPQDTADTDVTVTLANHKEVHYRFTAAEYLSTARDLVSEHAEAQAVAIGNALVDAVAALITAANFSSAITQPPAGASFSTVTSAAKRLNINGAPDFSRFGWVNSDLAEALANDQVVMEYLDRSAARTAYARWSGIKGFDEIWEYPALPASGNLVGFFFQRAALLLVTRVADDPSTLIGAGYPGQLQVITDPVSGFSVLSDRWVDQNTRAINMRLDVLYGVARGLGACGVRIVSA